MIPNAWDNQHINVLISFIIYIDIREGHIIS